LARGVYHPAACPPLFRLSSPPTIALCIEVPLALRGGVSVLVETLILGLGAEYRFVLVSSDASPDQLPGETAALLAGQVRWDPSRGYGAECRRIAAALSDHGVQLAHFHAGNNAWRSRWTGVTPVTHIAARGIPCLMTNHMAVSIWDGCSGPPDRLSLRRFASFPSAWLGKLWMLAALERELAVSEHNCAALRRWYFPYRHRFQTLYHSRLREVAGEPCVEREKTIVSVGHVATRKGQHLLTEAFARIAPDWPEWRLLLIGPMVEPECEAAIRQIIASHRLEDRVQLLGERRDAMDFMQKAGIYVQPSLHEGLPLSVQEALYHGCPTIATRVSGTPEIVADGDNGLLVEAGDSRPLAAALVRLLGDLELRLRLAARGRPSILERGMTLRHMLQRHREIYAELLA
jgi:glycosyltransferase involved in cell wall biosynthesis